MVDNKFLRKDRQPRKNHLMDRFIPQLTSKEAYNCKTTKLFHDPHLVGDHSRNPSTRELFDDSMTSPSPERFSSPDILFNNSMDHYTSISAVGNTTTVAEDYSLSEDNKTDKLKLTLPTTLHNTQLAQSLGFNNWDTRVYKYGDPMVTPESPRKQQNMERLQEESPLLNRNRPNRRNLKSHIPYRVLDAPCLRNDFYSNLIAWSHTTGYILVGLGCSVYLWSTDLGAIQILKHDFLNIRNDRVTCVSFAPKGSNKFVVGTKNGWIYLFDQTHFKSENTRRVNDDIILDEFHSVSVKGISCIEWLKTDDSTKLGFIFGEENGYVNLMHINENIIGVKFNLISRFRAQSQQVCGISLNYNDQQIAVGGNDNSCSLWDISNHMSKPGLKFTFFHKAAIKAVAFCPWSKSLLATGGGTKDKIIKFWHTGTGTLINKIETQNQITSLTWSRHYKQIVATFGFGDVSNPMLLTMYNYPSLEPILQVKTPHPLRALSCATSPNGSSLCVGTTDETIRFYELWDSDDNLLIKDIQDNGIYGSVLIEHLEGINYSCGRTKTHPDNSLR